MAKMIKCKTCGADIAQSAKTCPHCGAKNKQLHPVAATVVGILMLLFVIVVIFSQGNSNDETKNVTHENNNEPAASNDGAGISTNNAAGASTNDVTDTTTQITEKTPEPAFTPVNGTIGDWEITVNDFSYSKHVSVGLLHQYTASENSQYCLVNVTVKNIGSSADTFLPYISYGKTTSAKIKWNGYEYTRSELILSNDNLSSEQLNPLVTATGDIAFDVPEDLINSDTPPTFVIKEGNETFTCELVKE